MATLNAKARNKLSDDQFAWVDDDGVGHLPINDAAHTRNAMARFDQTDFPDTATKAKARSKILAAAKKFGIDVSKFANNPLADIFDGLAKKIKGKAEMSHVTLDATFAVESEEDDGDDLILTGRLFKAGDYPTQSFSMTPLELHEVFERFFGPVPMDLHHKSSVFANADLRGQLGQVEEVWTDESGEWLMAKARKPKWLHEIMKETKVSATFAREPKQLIATAWTHDPVVSDAQLIAAFAKHNTPTGQMAMQRIHDAAVDGGAVCNKPAAMASKHENKAIQDAHDISVEHGAQCQSLPNGQAMPISTYAHTPTRRKKMGLRELLKGTATDRGEDIDDEELDALFAREPDPKVAQLEAALKEANDRAALLEASQKNQDVQFARLHEERRHNEAVAFANKQIADGRLPVAAAEKLIPLIERISKHDATATFADGEKSDTTLLEEFMVSLGESYAVFGKTIAPDMSIATLFSQETTKTGDEASQATVDKMLAATANGREILKRRQQNGKA